MFSIYELIKHTHNFLKNLANIYRNIYIYIYYKSTDYNIQQPFFFHIYVKYCTIFFKLSWTWVCVRDTHLLY